MPNKPSKRSVARYGRWNISDEVARALMKESARIGQPVEKVASEILRYWYEDVYLPTQKLTSSAAPKP